MSVLAAEIRAPRPTTPQRRPWPRATTLLTALATANFAAVLLVAVLMRGWHLGNIPGMNGDEAWSGLQALKWLHGEPIAWRTPTGNPLNLFFFLPLAGLHLVFSPSFVLLRSVALASGLLALAANYWLCRRTFDMRTAATSTLLLAALPVNIAYSRFAWDASQTLLASVFVLYLSLMFARDTRRSGAWPTTAMVALAAAILVHPTNILLAPLLVVPLVFQRREQFSKILAQTRSSTTRLPYVVILLAGAAIGYFAWPAFVRFVARVASPAEAASFAEYYLNLFSGATVYQFISGAGTYGWSAVVSAAATAVFAALALAGLVGLRQRLKSEPSETDAALVLAWFSMLLGFYLLAGTAAIAPHYERYAICLVAPGVLLLGRGLTWWIRPQAARATLAMISLVLAAWCGPASFALNYFIYIETTGGTSHRTFQTAAIEPKLQALEQILAADIPPHATEIVTSQWWIHWPIAYLAFDNSRVRVSTLESWQNQGHAQQLAGADHTWFVEFSDSDGQVQALAWCKDAGLIPQCDTICDCAKRPLLELIRPRPKYLQNY